MHRRKFMIRGLAETMGSLIMSRWGPSGWAAMEAPASAIKSIFASRTQVVRFTALFALALSALAASPPDASLNLKLRAPIRTWDEAIPLGNGLQGGLLWGETNLLRLSLDRGDLWDLRTPPEIHEPGFTYTNLQRRVKERNEKEISRLFDAPYNGPMPTKIPGGRLEVLLDPSQSVEQFELDLATAEGWAHLNNGQRCDVFFSAVAPVALLHVSGPPPQEIRLQAAGSGPGNSGNDSPAVAKLGYPPAKTGQEKNLCWFEQSTAGGAYAVCAVWRRQGNATLIAVCIGTQREGASALDAARVRAEKALKDGYEASLKPHAKWWAAFWEKSAVQFPEPEILRHYYLVRYFYGAASRLGAPPMPLQGVWTADAGSLPPWKGDYHNDLNTQMTYMGYQGAGNFDEGRCFLDFNWNLLPAFRQFARDFYGTPGANVPGVMSLSGDPLTGWGQYSLSPTMGPWIAHLFYLHWRYTADDRFLRTRAYPWCRELGQSLQALLKPDAQGVLRLPLSTSPEIHGNSLSAWLTPNSNYDLFSLKMMFLALSEMADACHQRSEAAQWAKVAVALGITHTSADGALKLDAQEELRESHRHLSNLIGIYPFNVVTVEGGEADRRQIRASLEQWDKLGTGGWCGYSFSWMAALRARVGDAETALRNLDVFVSAFILRNGFHVNGDQTHSGFSDYAGKPFTLEGNMLVMAAVHEMLLQSWSPTPGVRDTGVIRLFPATPWRWHDAAFESLRAEGGHQVSARRQNNATTWFRLVAGKEGLVRIRDDFGGRIPQWNRRGIQKESGDFVIKVTRGDVIEARMPNPTQAPPAPPNAAERVIIRPRQN